MGAPADGRLRGLDTLRALAIALVLLYHWRVYMGAAPALGAVAEVGWAGVDLFFVLSGYLIAQQLLKDDLRRLSLGGFWARRALRTWPLFWLTLLGYGLGPDWLQSKEPPALWRFLSFTQNVFLQPGTTFSHAWSLCVEEQFYLLLPLAALALARLRVGRRGVWALLLLLCGAGLAARGWAWWQHGRGPEADPFRYYAQLYYASWCRADEFLPGIAVALLQHRHPQAWAWLQARPRALMGGALAACALAVSVALFCGGWDEQLGVNPWHAVAGYSLLAWAFALLVAAALTPGTPLARWRVPGAASLALWSYAIYLSHRWVALAVKQFLGLDRPLLALGLTLLGSLLLGAALSRWVEQAILRWRDRHAPPLFRRAAAEGFPRAGLEART